jgi:hypothetical protein
MESIHAFATSEAPPVWHMAIKPRFYPPSGPFVLGHEAELRIAISLCMKIQASMLHDLISFQG